MSASQSQRKSPAFKRPGHTQSTFRHLEVISRIHTDEGPRIAQTDPGHITILSANHQHGRNSTYKQRNMFWLRLTPFLLYRVLLTQGALLDTVKSSFTSSLPRLSAASSPFLGLSILQHGAHQRPANFGYPTATLGWALASQS